MLVYGQVSGIAYRQPTTLTTGQPSKPGKLPAYAVSAHRHGEDHFVTCDTVEEAYKVQAALMNDGWVTVINPPPPKLKNGNASAARTKGKRNPNVLPGRPDAPNAEKLPPLPAVELPPPPTHNTTTQACGTCHMLPCECNYPLFIAPYSEVVVAADGTVYHNKSCRCH